MSVLIPVNTVYCNRKSGKTFRGNGIEQFPAKFCDGDTYRAGCYLYTFHWNQQLKGFHVKVLDSYLVYYPPILSEINGWPIVSLHSTFSDCQHMINAPEIPASVTELSSAFIGCYSLEKAPEIPDGVTKMANTFAGCKALKKAPVIPENVHNIIGAFSMCVSLKGSLVCNANPRYCTIALRGTQISAVIGDCTEATKLILLRTRIQK